MDHMNQVSMLMPDTRLWRPADLFMLFMMWAVMMVAMMVPSVTPMVLVFASVNRQRRQNENPFVPTWIFLSGYLFIWTGFSILATLGQWVLHTKALLSPMMVSANFLFGSALLVGAGIFQLTPIKNACLKHCRSPFDFIMTRWLEGKNGAFIMGLKHGAYCTGCCWMLMVLLFVVGIMNLFWITAITVFVFIEKASPRGIWVSRVSGFILIGWGCWLFLTHR